MIHSSPLARSKRIERLNDKNSRKKIIKSFELNKKRRMDHVLLSYLPKNPELEGMTVSQLSKFRYLFRSFIVFLQSTFTIC